jgi:hypothetical protein
MEHCFIVRFYRDPALTDRVGTQDFFVGLVEDVQNGNKASFQSPDELVKFMLAGQSLDGNQPDTT